MWIWQRFMKFLLTEIFEVMGILIGMQLATLESFGTKFRELPVLRPHILVIDARVSPIIL